MHPSTEEEKIKTVRLVSTEGEVEDYQAVLGQYVTLELQGEAGGMPIEVDGEIVEILELEEDPSEE